MVYNYWTKTLYEKCIETILLEPKLLKKVSRHWNQCYFRVSCVLVMTSENFNIKMIFISCFIRTVLDNLFGSRACPGTLVQCNSECAKSTVLESLEQRMDPSNYFRRNGHLSPQPTDHQSCTGCFGLSVHKENIYIPFALSIQHRYPP